MINNILKYVFDRGQYVSILLLSIGVLINAFFIPVYTGAALFSSESNIPIYNLRQILGLVANSLIIVGTAGQIFYLFRNNRQKHSTGE